jgi:phage/plasmid-associated DNA primase
LGEKLRAEFPGILAWVDEGFRLYQLQGLEKPTVIAACLSAWRDKCDNVGRFVVDRCVLNKQSSIEPTPLDDAYQLWCKEIGRKAPKCFQPEYGIKAVRRPQRPKAALSGNPAGDQA